MDKNFKRSPFVNNIIPLFKKGSEAKGRSMRSWHEWMARETMALAERSAKLLETALGSAGAKSCALNTDGPNQSIVTQVR